MLDASLLPAEVQTEGWVGLSKVIRILSERTVNMGEKHNITSLDVNAFKISKLVRSHWLVENQLHYSLDVNFSEDASRKLKANQAKNFSIILKMAINALKPLPDKMSIKRKRNHYAYYGHGILMRMP